MTVFGSGSAWFRFITDLKNTLLGVIRRTPHLKAALFPSAAFFLGLVAGVNSLIAVNPDNPDDGGNIVVALYSLCRFG